MAVVLDPQDGVIYKGIHPLLFPVDANDRPSAFLSGFDVNDNVVLASFTTDRKLRVDASVSIDSVNIGEVDIKGDDASGVSHEIGVVLNPDSTTFALYSQDQRMYFSPQNELKTLSRVEDAAGVIIDPASEQTLGAILTQLQQPNQGVAGTPLNIFGSQVNVASGIQSAIASYTVPAGKTFFLRHASFSGTNIGTFWVDIDGSVQARKRTYFTDFNGDFFFEGDSGQGLKVVAGSVVTVYGEHMRSSIGDFDASMDGRLS